MRLQVRSRRALSPFATGLMAVPFLLAGGAVGALALGWIGPGTGTTPAWVVGCIALVFLAGGIALLGIALERARVTAAAAVAIALGITAVFHWVAFGGGPREFASRSEVAGQRVERPVGERRGRWAFGAFALAMDAALAYWAVAAWRRGRRGAGDAPAEP